MLDSLNNINSSYFKLMEPERVEEEDEVEDEVAHQSTEDQRLPSVPVSQRTRYHDEHHHRHTLQHTCQHNIEHSAKLTSSNEGSIYKTVYHCKPGSD